MRCYLPLLALAPAIYAAPVQLARGGVAVQPVTVAPGSGARVRAAAGVLADYLSRITGATFAVEDGDGTRGIAVGLGLDSFNHTATPVSVAAADREAYRLRSHPAGLLVLGATELAVEDAVWDLLYRVGYRQYFPGANWEVVPHSPSLAVDFDVLERPDYLARRIWYGFGAWDYNAAPYRIWCARNRCVQGVDLRTGHSYDGFVKANRAAFEAHPEYWPLIDGERKQVNKPCLGNPAVRKLFVDHVLAQFANDPTLDSVSMDPSDGGNWCECERCAALGSVSDQVVTVANEVAAAVNAQYPGRLVGIYAYNYHSPPPSIRVNPQVVVSVATAFLKGGLTLDEILAGWSQQGATLGIREYYSVNTWDRDVPGAARGGNLAYLARTIPEFHAKGARFLSAESSDNWGPNGLGYWLAARMLWDVDEAARIDGLVDDFLTTAFGRAAEPMREFYRQLDGGRPHLVADDQLGRMFRSLEAATKLADTPEVRARIDDLTLYAQYASRYHTYETAAGPERQASFEALIRHAYRMRQTMMVHTKALYRDLVNRDKTVTIPEGAGWQVAEAENPWKSSEPFSAAELAALVRDGIAAHPVTELTFEPISYSNDLVPATSLELPTEMPTGEFGAGRGTQTFYTYVDNDHTVLQLHLTGGLIAHYRDRGNVRVELHRIGGQSAVGERETLVGTDRSVPPDGVSRTIAFTVREPGLYRITVNDGSDKTLVTWPAAQPMTVLSTGEFPMTGTYGQWSAYFYVPRGTKAVGLFGGGHGEIRDSHDRPLFWLNGREPNYYSVPVPPGEDGRVWQMRYAKGAVRLLTVPSCFATTPAALLLPREVLEADQR